MADLLEQIYAASPARETKADILDYFQGNTRRAAQHGIEHGFFVNQKTGKPIKLESGMRRFQSRGGRSQGETSDVYRRMGEQLPPRVPEGGYHIYGTVWMKFSDGDCEEREVDEVIEGDEARALLNLSSAGAAQAVVNHYMEDALWDEPSARIGDCNPPDLQVEPIGE